MKIMKKTFKATLALVLLGSAVFSQSLADAKKAIDAEQYLKAKSILKGLIKAKPADAENYFYLGDIYLKDEYVDSAKITFAQGVTADVEYPLNYVGLGAIDLENNNKVAAKANFEKAKSFVKKKDYTPFLNAAKFYTFASVPDFDAALSYLEAAKLLNSKDAQISLAFGDTYRERNDNSKGDLSASYKAYQEAYTLDNSLLRAKVETAVIIKRAQAWEDAIKAFNEVIAINPNYGPAYRELAETYRLWARVETTDRDLHFNKALDAYKKYLDLTDKSLESQLRYAEFLVYTRNWSEVKRVADEMGRVPGVNLKVRRFQGYGAYENKNFPEAEERLTDFISKAESGRIIPQDYYFRGRARMENGKMREALGDLKKAVEMDSTNAEDVSAVALKLYSDKKYAEAAELYESSASKNASASKKATDYFNMGMSNYNHFLTNFDRDTVNRQKGMPLLVKADSAFSYLNRIAPTFVGAYNMRAQVMNKKDDPKNLQGLAIPYYEKYIEVVKAKSPTLADADKITVINTYKSSIAFNIFYKKYQTATDPLVKLAALQKTKEYLQKVTDLNPDDIYSPAREATATTPATAAITTKDLMGQIDTLVADLQKRTGTAPAQ